MPVRKTKTNESNRSTSKAELIRKSRKTESESASPESQAQSHPIRSYRRMLSLYESGSHVGMREGHDWVIGFPNDPGKDTKEKLAEAGFSYRSQDHKWVMFTHAPNRAKVEELTKALKNEYGDDILIADYSVKQVVIAFDSKPDEKLLETVKDNGFFYRPDQTWNADYSPEKYDQALEIAKSLPSKGNAIAS